MSIDKYISFYTNEKPTPLEIRTFQNNITKPVTHCVLCSD